MGKAKFYRILFFLMTLLILVCTSVLFVFSNSSFLKIVSSPVNSLVSRIDYVVSSPFRFTSSTVQDLKDLLNTYRENESLKSQISVLKNQEETVKQLQAENEYLKSEISTSSSFSNPVNLVAQVIVRSPASWYENLIVNVGSDYGVKKGMLVTSKGALIGKVSLVSSHSSTVELLSSGKKFDIPIKISNDTLSIYGLLTSFDSSSKQFTVTELNAPDTIREGSEVLTSGLDGESASDIVVGSVNEVRENSGKTGRKVLVSPKTDFETVRYVTIVGN